MIIKDKDMIKDSIKLLAKIVKMIENYEDKYNVFIIDNNNIRIRKYLYDILIVALKENQNKIFEVGNDEMQEILEGL